MESLKNIHPLRWVTLVILLSALLVFPFADLAWLNTDPVDELMQIGLGLVTPQVSDWHQYISAILLTLQVALIAVAVAHIVGLFLAFFFHWGWVRWICAFLRAIHELFWAMLFMQVFGLTPMTAIIAISIPFSCMMARVYHDLITEADSKVAHAIQFQSDAISLFIYAKLALTWPSIKDYLAYRSECAVRSSAILGFVGIPTLGFHLETTFKQGVYDEASAWLIALLLLLLPLRKLLNPSRLILVAFVALFLLPETQTVSWPLVKRFITQDLWPQSMGHFWNYPQWLWSLWAKQGLMGLTNTLIVTQLSLVMSGGLALISFWTLWHKQFSWKVSGFGYASLLFIRSIPEIVLAFIFTLILGASMWPAILALGLHNGAIVSHLTGVVTSQQVLRKDVSNGLNLIVWEIIPRGYRHLLTFLLYRWEIIFRESAVIGLLGIPTLGFFIDSAFENIRMDVAVGLMILTALANIFLETLTRKMRSWSRLSDSPLTD